MRFQNGMHKAENFKNSSMRTTTVFFFMAGGLLLLNAASAQQKAKPEDTEFYTPVPKVVDPGKAGCGVPSDAVVLFDGSSANQWVRPL
jgi:hypothetical protein